jgi:small subunit ribosomal protein S6
MSLYEHIMIARQDISPQQVETMTENLKNIIESGGGKLTKTEYWGLRNMTYRIKKNRKGHYSLFNIDAPHEAIAEMERQMRLNEDILRFMTVSVDEHEEGESAALRFRAGRDDRRGGRDDRGGRGRDDRPRRDDRPQRDDRPKQDDRPQQAEKPKTEGEA